MEEERSEMEDALTQCEKENEQLKEENDHLRKSAESFGDLAERLNARNRPKRALDRETPGATRGAASGTGIP